LSSPAHGVISLAIWSKSKSKYFRFYEVASNWPRGTGSQRYSTAKIIFTK
jgi:hypothetical protein